MTTTTPVGDLYRIVGEYLADPRLRITGFGAQAGSVSLSVVDTGSLRYAYTLITPGRFSYVGTVAVSADQQVTVVFTRADGVYVSVTLTVTDPAVVTRLRAVRNQSSSPQRVLAVLPGPGDAR